MEEHAVYAGAGSMFLPSPQTIQRLRTFASVLTRPALTPWYGAQVKSMEMTSGTGLWHVAGSAPARLRRVLVRPAGADGAKACAAFFSTDTAAHPEQVLACSARRWNIAVFFEEVRVWLEFEKQRGWCNSTIGRSTPCLFGVFSLVALLAKRLYPEELPVWQAAWCKKENATFSEALFAVRAHLWEHNAVFVCHDKVLSGVNPDPLLILGEIMMPGSRKKVETRLQSEDYLLISRRTLAGMKEVARCAMCKWPKFRLCVITSFIKDNT